MSDIDKTIRRVKIRFDQLITTKAVRGLEPDVLAIITAYEQSQTKIGQMESAILEDYETSLALKTELLAALNNIQGELFDFAILFNVALLEIPNHKKQITDYIDKIENMAFKIITKHKGE